MYYTLEGMIEAEVRNPYDYGHLVEVLDEISDRDLLSGLHRETFDGRLSNVELVSAESEPDGKGFVVFYYPKIDDIQNQ